MIVGNIRNLYIYYLKIGWEIGLNDQGLHWHSPQGWYHYFSNGHFTNVFIQEYVNMEEIIDEQIK